MRILLVMVSLLIFFTVGDAWGQIMQLPPTKQHSTPSPGVNSQVEVPEVRGWTQERANQQLNRVGLTSSVEERHSVQPKGTVIDQDPKPGTRVDRNSQVRLTVAKP
jgi:hypothetical protein